MESPLVQWLWDCRRRMLGAVFVGLVVASTSGCIDGSIPLTIPQNSAVFQGSDSAGAHIEIKMKNGRLLQARVTDVALGQGEAPITTYEDDRISFTVQFPAGVSITYEGERLTPDQSVVEGFSGRWAQHAGGVFGADSGEWSVEAAGP